MNRHELTEMQKKLLEMLTWYDRFCRENSLTYYAVGGTLLGAVRHGGFIPWDDDIDVAMPRKDYMKLEKLMSGKQFGSYILETPNTDAGDFCYPYTKLYDTSTTLIEHCKKPLVRGLFLDIFPFDGIGNDKKEGLKWFRSISREYHFYLTRIAAIRNGRSFYKNAAVFLSHIIPKVVVDDVELRKHLDKRCRRYGLENSKYGGNLLGNWGKRELVPVEVIGNPQKYQFENIEIMGIEKYDRYLTNIYGEWRKVPPKEKQITHHDFLLLDLHKSYLEY